CTKKEKGEKERELLAVGGRRTSSWRYSSVGLWRMKESTTTDADANHDVTRSNHNNRSPAINPYETVQEEASPTSTSSDLLEVNPAESDQPPVYYDLTAPPSTTFSSWPDSYHSYQPAIHPPSLQSPPSSTSSVRPSVPSQPTVDLY